MKRQDVIAIGLGIGVTVGLGYIFYKSVQAKPITEEGEETSLVSQIRTGKISDKRALITGKAGSAWATFYAILPLKREGAFITEWIEETIQVPRLSGTAASVYDRIVRELGYTKTPGILPGEPGYISAVPAYDQWYIDAKKEFSDLFATHGVISLWRYGKTDEYTDWKEIEYAYNHGYIDGMPTVRVSEDPYYKQFLAWRKALYAARSAENLAIIDDKQKYITDEARADAEAIAIWNETVAPILQQKGEQPTQIIKISKNQDVGHVALWAKQYARGWSRDAIVTYLKSLGYNDTFINQAIDESGLKPSTAKEKVKAKKEGGQYGINKATGKAMTAQEYYAKQSDPFHKGVGKELKY